MTDNAWYHKCDKYRKDDITIDWKQKKDILSMRCLNWYCRFLSSGLGTTQYQAKIRTQESFFICLEYLKEKNLRFYSRYELDLENTELYDYLGTNALCFDYLKGKCTRL